ncbi:MAG TPA: tripartite tricarboxylate transporter substrate binding protein [Xanthobacteraceae bacterium]|nr:tripartite tricarboxylate transporter substrate binding protein [Xanthobacteraceae bacterium]
MGFGVTRIFAAASAIVLFATAASAQNKDQAADFPTKPVTLIIPVGAGGSHDLTARAVTSVANQYLGQPIVVELKPGGGGAIGSTLVANAAPDGYTLLFGGTNWSTTLPAVEGRSKGPDDLQAVCRINYSPVMVATRPDAPYKTFREMIEWAKANPGKLVFGHTGPWGQADLTWKQISQITGIQTRSVPHNGGGPLTVALLGGHVDVGTNPTTTYISHIQAGKIRPLAVLDDQRDSDFPDVPTAKEQGVDVVYHLWRAILAPKDTPRPVINKLADACKKMVEDKSVIAMIKKLGDEVQYLGPDEFEKVWRAEFKAHKELGESLKGK